MLLLVAGTSQTGKPAGNICGIIPKAGGRRYIAERRCRWRSRTRQPRLDSRNQTRSLQRPRGAQRRRRREAHSKGPSPSRSSRSQRCRSKKPGPTSRRSTSASASGLTLVLYMFSYPHDPWGRPQIPPGVRPYPSGQNRPRAETGAYRSRTLRRCRSRRRSA